MAETKIKFMDLSFGISQIREKIDYVLKKAIDNADFIGGAEITNFEREFSEFLIQDSIESNLDSIKSQQIPFVIGVGNGTDALEIAIKALNLPKNSEVLVPANTFAASAEAIINNGLCAIFVDCTSDYLLDLNDLKRKITPNSAAIIAVHLYGRSCNMDKILQIAKENNLKVIEDCAQAHGARFFGDSDSIKSNLIESENAPKVGTIGDIATFSFYPGKNLGAFGDGGAIVCKNKTIAQKARQIAQHGALQKYEHEIIGRNSRLDSIQAAILRVKLPHLDNWTSLRQNAAKMYFAELFGIGDLILPFSLNGAKIAQNFQAKKESLSAEFCQNEAALSVWHLFVIRTKFRDELKDFLAKNNIESGLHYPHSLPQCKAFSECEQVINLNAKNANSWSGKLLSLPMGEHMDKEKINRVCAAIKEFFTTKQIHKQ